MQVGRRDTLEIAHMKIQRDERALSRRQHELSQGIHKARRKVRKLKQAYKEVRKDIVSMRGEAESGLSKQERKRAQDYIGQRIEKLKQNKKLLGDLVEKFGLATQELQKNKLQQKMVSVELIKMRTRYQVRSENAQVEGMSVRKFVENAESDGDQSFTVEREVLEHSAISEHLDPSEQQQVAEVFTPTDQTTKSTAALDSHSHPDQSQHNTPSEQHSKPDSQAELATGGDQVNFEKERVGMQELQTWKTDHAEGLSLNYQTNSGRHLKLLLQKNSDNSIQVRIVQLDSSSRKGISAEERVEIRSALESSGLKIRSLYFEEGRS